MTVHELLTTTLSAVLPNSWAIELPPVPVWPAIVFDVDSRPEDAWCMGGGYTQHDVDVVVLSRSLDELDQLLPLAGTCPLRTALEALEPFQFEDACADADYEPDPEVYARSLTVRLRTPRY